MYRNLALKSYMYRPCNLKNLQVGDHLCLIYENDNENLIFDYIIEGLGLNQKVVCVTHSRDQSNLLNNSAASDRDFRKA